MSKKTWLSLAAILLLIALGGTYGVLDRRGDKLQERRIELLQNALAPKTPEGVAYSWAEAVKTRNGAWQYALMDNAMRKQNFQGFREVGWVTGVSSPWVQKYKVIRQAVDSQGNVTFQIKFDWYTSSGFAYSNNAVLVAGLYDRGQSNERWLISYLDFEDQPAP